MTWPSVKLTRTEVEPSEWSTASIDSVPVPTCTEMPSSPIILASNAPPASSICWAISRGIISTTWVCNPNWRKALAASSPSRPPPITTPAAACEVSTVRWASARMASRSSSVRYTWHAGRSWPGTGGTKANDPVARTKVS